MLEELNRIKAARKASGLSIEKAAKACGLSYSGYFRHEANPDEFRLGELRKLYMNLSEPGREIFAEGIGKIFY